MVTCGPWPRMRRTSWSAQTNAQAQSNFTNRLQAIRGNASFWLSSLPHSLCMSSLLNPGQSPGLHGQSGFPFCTKAWTRAENTNSFPVVTSFQNSKSSKYMGVAGITFVTSTSRRSPRLSFFASSEGIVLIACGRLMPFWTCRYTGSQPKSLRDLCWK